MSEQINQAKAQLEKLKVAEEKLKEAEANVKPIIQEIQQNIDESAKEMATQNAEHQKQKEELEVGIRIFRIKYSFSG
jgi:chromosome segregation ATPase